MPTVTVVHFRTSSGRYCVPVEAAVAVRFASGLVELPAPRAGVVGILPAEQPITVLSVLGSGRDHVLVLAAEGQTFGLLVEEVTGLGRIDAAEIRIAPDGQAESLISGVISRDDGLVLVADPIALASRL
jgi:chemotaxis signal transduction protein